MEVGGHGGKVGSDAVVTDYQRSDGGFTYRDAGGDGSGVVGGANNAEYALVGLVVGSA